MQDWNRAKQQWEKKEKNLEAEKAQLLQQYESIKASSEQRNNDLQRQINELKALYSQKSDAVGHSNRKIPKMNPVKMASPTFTASTSTFTDESMAVDNITPSVTATTLPDVELSKSDRPPPIFVYGVTNYAAFSKFLQTHQVSDCTRKETNSSLILTTSTAERFRALHTVLRTECSTQTGKDQFGTIQLHSYQLKSERAFVVFIRGLPSTMSTDEIYAALTEKNFTPRRVVNVPRKRRTLTAAIVSR